MASSNFWKHDHLYFHMFGDEDSKNIQCAYRIIKVIYKNKYENIMKNNSKLCQAVVSIFFKWLHLVATSNLCELIMLPFPEYCDRYFIFSQTYELLGSITIAIQPAVLSVSKSSTSDDRLRNKRSINPT